MKPKCTELERVDPFNYRIHYETCKPKRMKIQECRLSADSSQHHLRVITLTVELQLIFIFPFRLLTKIYIRNLRDESCHS